MAGDLRKTGIGVLSNVPWGAHICLFYETKDDLLDALVPYFKAGLESREFCVWAVFEPLTVEEVRTAFIQGIPNFERHVTAGNIEILSGREWYLKGDEFDLQRITGGWHEELRGALARGYEGIRISGNAFWLQTGHWKDFCEYEQEVDKSLAGKPVMALCTYSLLASRAVDFLEVARAHHLTAARRKGQWEFIETAAAPTTVHSLTPRELEVLSWEAQGKSARVIGEILGIAKRTVDEHTQTAIRKLGAANRTQAVAIALRRRLIEVGLKPPL